MKKKKDESVFGTRISDSTSGSELLYNPSHTITMGGFTVDPPSVLTSTGVADFSTLTPEQKEMLKKAIEKSEIFKGTEHEEPKNKEPECGFDFVKELEGV